MTHSCWNDRKVENTFAGVARFENQHVCVMMMVRRLLPDRQGGVMALLPLTAIHRRTKRWEYSSIVYSEGMVYWVSCQRLID